MEINAIIEILYQDGKTIDFESKKLNKSQQNYFVNARELCAIVYALKKYIYFCGAQFEIVFDHKIIKWFTQQIDLKGQKSRWAKILQEYDTLLRYCKG